MSNIKLTESQNNVLNDLVAFTNSDDRIFVLKGYAGTGKTTMMKFFIEHLEETKKSYKLLSTTGRAAKILSNYTNHKATTIHNLIYTYKSFNREVKDIDTKQSGVEKTGQLYLVFEPAVIQSSKEESSVIYIIDESSMISDIEDKNVIQAKFGSGRLLKELLSYDQRSDSKFVFVGDPCQLPPIQGTFSPALEVDYLTKTFSCGVKEAQLTQIMRQDGCSGIVSASAKLRKQWTQAPERQDYYGYNRVWGYLNIRNNNDVVLLRGEEEMESLYLSDIKNYGYNHSIFVCKRNKDCTAISLRIRQQLGYRKTIEVGDLLMVIQNQNTTGLMNGDMVEVLEIEDKIISTPENRWQTNLIFRAVKVKELFTQREYQTLLIEDTITSDKNNLTPEQQTNLFLDFIARMKDLGITEKKNKAKFDSSMREDSYLNALRCSYGYAVTCHKAQGGEWENVYIHFGARNITMNPTKQIYQWAYTAITRAKNKAFLVDEFYIK